MFLRSRSWLMLASACLIALTPTFSATRAVAQVTLPKIVIATPPSDDATPAIYAASAGIFRKNGLDVDLQKMGSGSAIAAALVGGDVQVGAVNTLSVVLAHANGVPFQILSPAGLYTGDNNALLLVKKDSPYRTARDLNGKIIGSGGVKDLNALATMAWLDQNGGDSSTTKVVEIPSSAIVVALDDGRIDMATIQVPVLTAALNSGKVRAIAKSWTAIAPRYQLSAWIVTSDWAAKNPDLARRFALSIREATRYTNAHKSETLPSVAAFTGVDAAIIAGGVRSNPSEYADPKTLQPVIDFAFKNGLIKKTFPAQEIINPLALAS